MNRFIALIPLLSLLALPGCNDGKTSARDALLSAQDSASKAAPAKPSPDMQAVLDELTAQNGKPIETLDVKEARKQPTPADAVKALLKKRNKSTDPQPVGNVDNQSITGPGGK
ncbi:MAG: hypothetical protein JO332_19925, partial [Planctomycetaceae bacterium]|nr:hypothetical protein [Planctomycetaceae bacterium]